MLQFGDEIMLAASKEHHCDCLCSETRQLYNPEYLYKFYSPKLLFYVILWYRFNATLHSRVRYFQVPNREGLFTCEYDITHVR